MATSRAVMSARSMQRPSTRNCQPSSRLIVASAMPLISAARSRTHWNAIGRPHRAELAGGDRARYVVLIASHIATDSVSRARRALSRAAARAAAIEAGDFGS